MRCRDAHCHWFMPDVCTRLSYHEQCNVEPRLASKLAAIMNSSIRHTPSLIGLTCEKQSHVGAKLTSTGKIDKLRDDLIRRFENLIGLAAVRPSIAFMLPTVY